MTQKIFDRIPLLSVKFTVPTCIRSRKVLFIGHDATRTGAPLLLLEFLRWLSANSSIQPSVLLKRGGEIESYFRTIGPTLCCTEETEALNRPLVWSVLRRLRLTERRSLNLGELYPVEQYPVVYANTVDTCDLAMRLVGEGRRLIHHIHELSGTTDLFGATESLKNAVSRTDQYIAASGAVQDFLEVEIGVPREKIEVIHEFPISVARGNCPDKPGQSLRRQLGIPDAAIVIGMCGLPQWRKGTDLFVQLAMIVARQSASHRYRFVWIGGDVSSQCQALYDVERLGLEEFCHFVPAVPNPNAYFSTFDLFALTSREDPFPVVMLEAATCGVPIVCFSGAGGAPELVGNDAGIVVPYLDVSAMAVACIELSRDAERRKQMGECARQKAANYSLEIQGPRLLHVLERVSAMTGTA